MPEDPHEDPDAATAIITKVRRVRASGQITRQLEQAILGGRLAAGDRLPSERELQGLLEVSRNTLREGLRELEQKGLVEIRKGRRGGIFVKEMGAGPMTESLGLFVQSQRVTMEDISEFRRDLEGPLALDVPLSRFAADRKSISSPVVEATDVLIAPDIEAANILYRAITYFAMSQSGGIIMGARVPLVLLSRAEPPETKIHSISLALLVVHQQRAAAPG